MAEVAKIKQQLKEWESAFFKVHQRKPAKDDVTQAPDKIKGLYRAYHAARRTSVGGVKADHTSENSSSHEAGGPDAAGEAVSTPFTRSAQVHHMESQQAAVWGPELNKKVGKKGSSDSQGSEDRKEGSTLLNKLGEKLFARCSSSTSFKVASSKTKFATPKGQNMSTSSQDSPSPSQMPSHQANTPTGSSSSVDKTPTSTATLLFNEEEFGLKGLMFERAVRLSTGKRHNSFDGADVPPKFLCSGRPRKRFSVGLNSECRKGELDCESPEFGKPGQASDLAGSEFNHLDFDSLEADAFSVADEVNSQQVRTFGGGPFPKSDGANGKHFPSDWRESVTDDGCAVQKGSQTTAARKPATPRMPHTDKPVRNESTAVSVRDAEKSDENAETWEKRERSTSRIAKSQKSHMNISDIVSSKDTGEREPSMFSMYAFKSDDKDDFGASFTADGRAESTCESKKGNSKEETGKRKAETPTRARKRKKLDQLAEDSHSVVGEGDGDDAEDRPEPPKKTAKKRKATGTTTISTARKSENFVRLNMKVKRFVRKGVSMTGSQWKRKQWKQKMAGRSKSFGDKCFRCGQSGHWANKCTAGSGAERVPSIGGDITPVDEEGYPSLKSAALMARGVKTDGVEPEADEELAVEAMVVRERREAVAVPAPITPFAQLVSDVEEEVQRGLDTFGFTSFKPGQRETITRILNGQSTLVILSTGGGKSLCYQLPAYLYAQHARGITLVISPLVSLMEDQVTGLPPGVRGACLNSNMTPAQRNGVLADVNAGTVHFLLVSPEAVVGGGGRGQGSFPSSNMLPPIFFACIDEVHCLSEWSHNFRPSYLRLCKVLREKYGVSCFLGLTATATKSTAADVAHHLGITDMDAATVRGSPVPPNLCLSVSRDENKDEALVNLLQGKRFSACASIIIYCTRRQQVERAATLVRTCLQTSDSKGTMTKKKRTNARKGSQAGGRPTPAFDPDSWSVESYHAGLTPAQRKRVQKGFMSGAVRVVVATVAFGMGLDKADVRGVIHYNMPKSFENYVQEIGRAGRDGETSHCHLFLDPKGGDLGELQRHTFGNSVDRHTLKKLLQRVFAPCRCQQVQELKDTEQRALDEAAAGARTCPGHERALVIHQTVHDLDVREEGLETLLCYLELHVPELVTSLSPVYATCQLQCYGGPAQLQAVAKKCPPVAVAIAKQKLRGKNFSTCNSVDFAVVDISDSMGWDSGPVKRELKSLQWTVADGVPRKSGVIVNFTDLAFRVRACGDVSVSELDALLDYLHERVVRQERTELAQLALLAKRLKGVSHKNYWMCADDVDLTRSQTLKRHLDDHFEDKGDDAETIEQLPVAEVDAASLSQLTADIRQFIHLYGDEHLLTGRAIARVLHGIHSPRFPATTWGRVRRFWRCQLHVHFHVVVREATAQLLLIR